MAEEKIQVTTEMFESRIHWIQSLNESPNSNWIKERKIYGGKNSLHVPIEKIQALADIYFSEWNVVDEKYNTIANEVIGTVKIKALPSYPGAKFEYFTGSAAIPIQTDKGSKVKDFPKGKKSNALEYNLPSVRSRAIANAFSTKGNVFGRNLGRAVSVDFNFIKAALGKKGKKKKKKSKKSKNAKK